MEKRLRALLPAGVFVGVSTKRSRRMGAVRGKGNRTTEARARALFVRAGLRGWCMHPAEVEGRPDFFFAADRLAIFIDGCFWHGCSRCGHIPKTNSGFWAAKIQRNRERDQATSRVLRRQGVRVLRVWEHDVRKVAKHVVRLIESP
jgi:DNA mismatch endonuclease (patch repair protein)